MTKQTKRPYTGEELDRLISLRNDGHTEREIAKLLDRPYNSVHWKIKELRRIGRLPIIRDLTPLSPDDVMDISVNNHISVEDVELIIAQVGSRLQSKLHVIETAVQMWNAQEKLCFYYGVPISLTASVGNPSKAVLMAGRDGGLVWASRMATRMRGRLSHDVFLNCISKIYNHVFT